MVLAASVGERSALIDWENVSVTENLVIVGLIALHDRADPITFQIGTIILFPDIIFCDLLLASQFANEIFENVQLSHSLFIFVDFAHFLAQLVVKLAQVFLLLSFLSRL